MAVTKITPIKLHGDLVTDAISKAIHKFMVDNGIQADPKISTEVTMNDFPDQGFFIEDISMLSSRDNWQYGTRVYLMSVKYFPKRSQSSGVNNTMQKEMRQYGEYLAELLDVLDVPYYIEEVSGEESRTISKPIRGESMEVKVIDNVLIANVNYKVKYKHVTEAETLKVLDLETTVS